MGVITTPTVVPEIKLSIENAALLGSATVCPAGMRATVTVPWHDFSSNAGKVDQYANLTNGTNTYPAYIGRRVSTFTALAHVDLPAMTSGVWNASAPHLSTRGQIQTDYRLDLVDFGSWVGTTRFTSAPSWTDVVGATGALAFKVGTTSGGAVTGDLIYWDAMEAIFWVQDEITITLNGRDTKFICEGFVYLRAGSARRDFELQCVWSDRTDPRARCAGYLSGGSSPFPGWTIDVGASGDINPWAHFQNALGMTWVEDTSITMPSLPEFADGAAMPCFGSFLRTDLATANEVSQFNHWKELPPEVICHHDTMVNHFDALYPFPVKPVNTDSWGPDDTSEAYWQSQISNTISRIKNGGNYTDWFGVTSARASNQSGKQDDFGVHKKGTLWYVPEGNTAWQNTALHALHKEFLRPRDFRQVDGKPIAYENFPEGTVDTVSKQSAINSQADYGHPDIIFYDEVPKTYLNFGLRTLHNTLGKTQQTAASSNGFFGYKSTHNSQNTLMTMYKLTGSMLLKRKIQGVANAYLFQNHTRGDSKYLHSGGKASYVSTIGETRELRSEQVAGACLDCLRGPDAITYTASHFHNNTNQLDTDTNLINAIKERFERLQNPASENPPTRPAADFDRYRWARMWVNGQKGFGDKAIVSIWYVGAENRLPLLYTASPLWETTISIPGVHAATEWLEFLNTTDTVALARWKEFRFWNLHTMMRWGFIQDRHPRTSFSETNPNFNTPQTYQWWCNRFMKLPTRIPTRNVDNLAAFLDGTNEPNLPNNKLRHDTAADAVADLYIANPWPIVPGKSGGNTYGEKFDLTEPPPNSGLQPGPRKGARVCYEGHNNGKWGFDNDPVKWNNDTLYCNSFSSWADDFYHWAVAGARILGTISENILAAQNSTTSEREAATESIKRCKEFLTYWRAVEVAAAPNHSSYVSATSGSYPDWMWATDFDETDDGPITETFDPVKVTVKAPGVTVPSEVAFEPAIVDIKAAGAVGFVFEISSGDLPMSEGDANGHIAALAPHGPVTVKPQAFSSVTLGGLQILWRSGGSPFSEALPELDVSGALLGLSPVQVKNIGSDLRQPANDLAPGKIIAKAPGLNLVYNLVAGKVMVVNAGIYTSAQDLAPAKIKVQSRLGYKFDGETPDPDLPENGAKLRIGKKADGFPGSPLQTKQNFTLNAQDSIVLAYSYNFDTPLDGTETATWKAFAGQDSASSFITKSSIDQREIVVSKKSQAVFVILTPEDTASVTFKQGETKKLFFHELELTKGLTTVSTSGRMLLTRDLIV